MTLNEFLALPDQEYVTEADLASVLDRDINTMRRWAVDRKGPPRTRMGRTVVYRVGAFRQWLLAQERDYDAEQAKRRKRAA